jgi:hypothetical protein
MSEIAVQRGLAECGDLVHERLTKHRTAWVKKFSNKPLPEIVRLYVGSANRTCNYSRKLFDVVRQKHPEIEDEGELWNRYEIVAGWIRFYALRCEYFQRRRKRSRSNCLPCLTTSLTSLIRADMNSHSLNITNMSEWLWRN